MGDNLKRYAEEIGLNPTHAGEVLFTVAATETLIPDGHLEPEDLELIGIVSADTKEQIEAKLLRAIDRLEHESKSPEDLKRVFSNDLRRVLEWVKS